jgi:hypothetical protein
MVPGVRVERSGRYELAGHGFGVAAMFCLRFCSVWGNARGGTVELVRRFRGYGQTTTCFAALRWSCQVDRGSAALCSDSTADVSDTSWLAGVGQVPPQRRTRATNLLQPPSRIRCAEATGVRLHSNLLCSLLTHLAQHSFTQPGSARNRTGGAAPLGHMTR